jgi:predicted AlkP superfamily phosphohydrolase/phosphomutase
VTRYDTGGSDVRVDAGDTGGSGDRAGGDRAFVLGLDGVPWPLLEPWIRDGELPAFTQLVEEGAAGPLRSTVPANTPVAWPSIATGTCPDRHGLYEFMKLESDYSQRPYGREDWSQPALWELLAPAVVANVPMTYPAGGLDDGGRMVAGMMTPSPESDGFTYPAELADEIRARIPDYRIGLKWHRYGPEREAEFRSDLGDLLDSRRELLELLMDTDDWRLFFFTLTAPDRLQHLVWDEDVILDHYRDVDEILGDVMDYCARREATLYVVSDHGFGPISKVVYPNRALADAGLLTPKEPGGLRALLSRSGLTKERVLGSFERLGIDDETLVGLLPRRLVDAAARQIPGDHALYDVESEQTRAFLHGLGSVYINDRERFESGAVDPADRESVKEEVMTTLSALTDPATDEPVLSVHDGDKLNPEDDYAPDVVVEGVDGYHVKSALGSNLLESADGIAGYHRPQGVFFAWGESIEAGATPTEATVVDVAPTLLHELGEPVPTATHGRVLQEVFETGSAPAERSVATVTHGPTASTEGDTDASEEVEERLRGLGYL